MTRIHIVKKARKDQGFCLGCRKPILAGDSYSWIEFRFGGRRVKCASCRFRPSEMTQSHLSNVYAAQESFEDFVKTWEGTDLEDLTAEVENDIDVIRDVAEEYRNAAEAIREVADNSIAEQNEENADQLSDWCDELERAMDELEPFEGECDEEENPEDRALAEAWRKKQAEVITDILFDGFPL